MSRRRRWIFAAVIGVVCVMGGILVVDYRTTASRTLKLSDGSVVTVRGFSSGTRHRFVSGNVWQRMAASALSDSWARKVGASVHRYYTGRPSFVLWIEGNRAVSGLQTAALVTDEAGSEISGRVVHSTQSEGRVVKGAFFFALPTGSRALDLVVDWLPYEAPPGVRADPTYKRVLVAVPNPAFVRRPKWRAAPYPIIAEKDGVVFRLERFGSARTVEPTESERLAIDNGKDPLLRYPEMGTGILRHRDNYGLLLGQPFMELAYTIQDRANPDAHWRMDSLGLLTEAGNEWVPGGQSHTITQQLAAFRFAGALGTNAPWKLRAKLIGPPGIATTNDPTLALPPERIIEVIAQPTAAR